MINSDSIDTKLREEVAEINRLLNDLNILMAISRCDELISKNTNEFNLAILYNLKGEVLLLAESYSLAATFFYDALSKATKLCSDEIKAESLVGLSYVYRFLDQYTQSISYADEALSLIKKTEVNETLFKALLSKGVSLYRIGDYENSNITCSKAFDLAVNLRNDYLIGSALKTKGDLFLAQKNYKLAIEFYHKFETDSGFDKHYVLKSMVLIRLAECFEGIGDRENAILLSNKSYKLAVENNFKAGQKNCLLFLSKIYESNNDLESAYNYLKKYNYLINENISDKTLQKVSKMEFDFFIESKEKEIILLKEIKEKHDSINASLNYAAGIQGAILPKESFINKGDLQYFVYFKPKEQVGGDFYWIESFENSFVFCLADCTGHGIPGAMLSMLCSNLVRTSLKTNRNLGLDKVISKVNHLLHDTLGLREVNNVNDGMDISICSLSKKDNGDYWELKFSGANHVGVIISDEKILQTAYNRTGLSIQTIKDYKFDETIYKLNKGDSFYMFSDGYPDQFGGITKEGRLNGGKKFKYKRLIELLKSLQKLDVVKQSQILDDNLNEWKGDLEQIDDICIIGVKL